MAGVKGDARPSRGGRRTRPDAPPRQGPLGAGLLRAWAGYRQRVDEALAAAGFDDRRYPDGRVLRICARTPNVTISQIGRELGMTRQGAGKIVASLRDRQYVTLNTSPKSSREKVVALTSRAEDFLAAQRKAARQLDDRLRAELGVEAFDGLQRLLQALGANEELDPGRHMPGAAIRADLLDAQD
jgi:DNA-binding MarR family transcriptional regulator